MTMKCQLVDDRGNSLRDVKAAFDAKSAEISRRVVVWVGGLTEIKSMPPISNSSQTPESQGPNCEERTEHDRNPTQKVLRVTRGLLPVCYVEDWRGQRWFIIMLPAAGEVSSLA
jgi:hypothetical protein